MTDQNKRDAKGPVAKSNPSPMERFKALARRVVSVPKDKIERPPRKPRPKKTGRKTQDQER